MDVPEAPVQKKQLTASALIDPNVASMTSEQIADLVGSRHGDVIRDVKKMVEDLATGDDANLRHVEVRKDSRGYTSQIMLPRRETDILLTGYSTPLRAKVIDRWRELEAQVAKPNFAVPTTFHAALMLAAELEEQRAVLTHQVEVQGQKITEDAPKVDYYSHVRDAKNTETIDGFAKMLGLGERKLFKWLREQKILMGDNSPYQKHIDAGHFRVLDKDHTNPKGKKITYKQTVLTGKGKTYVQKRLKKAGNPALGDDE